MHISRPFEAVSRHGRLFQRRLPNTSEAYTPITIHTLTATPIAMGNRPCSFSTPTKNNRNQTFLIATGTVNLFQLETLPSTPSSCERREKVAKWNKPVGFYDILAWPLLWLLNTCASAWSVQLEPNRVHLNWWNDSDSGLIQTSFYRFINSPCQSITERASPHIGPTLLVGVTHEALVELILRTDLRLYEVNSELILRQFNR